MNRGEIRYAAFMRAGYDPGRELPMTEFDPYFDEGVSTVAALYDWPFLLTTATVGVTAAQQEYSIVTDWSITDFLSPHSLIQVGKRFGKIRQISFETYIDMFGDDPDTSDVFDYYYMKARSTIGVHPVPVTTNASALKFSYYTQPTFMATDTDSPEWDASFHHILIDHVAGKICENLEDFERAQFFQQRFLALVAEMKDFYERRAEAGSWIFGDGTGMNTQTYRQYQTLNLPFS